MEAKGKEVKLLSGFEIDKEEALRELEESIKLFEKRDEEKGFIFRVLTEQNKKISDEATNWSFVANTNMEYVNINLRWAKKNIKTINGVPIRHAKVALMS